MSEAIKSRVLVVDDEKLIRWSIGSRLERSGYELHSCESGERAIEEVAAWNPDLMLLDVRLPGIDGIETLRRALRVAPGLAVVMMSAHSTVDIAVAAMKDGAADFLVKPFPLQELEAVVERALSAVTLRRQITTLSGSQTASSVLQTIVGESSAAEDLRALVVRLAAAAGATVLIEGESGVGKEVLARAIHTAGPRAVRPFRQINCAALPEHLLESELFGHERGAFTDAHAQKRGLVEAAEGGVVFLDEIGELPAGGQAKLLQLLESKTFHRVGGVQEMRADVRVVAASNARLEDLVTAGRFRADLFFRLNVVRVEVPPLRRRAGDIPLLVAHFIARFNREMKRTVTGVSTTAMEALQAHSWPGNIRELRNVIERALILHPNAEELRPEHLPLELVREPRETATTVHVPDGGLALESVERRLIQEALEKTGGNQSRAARLLGVSRDTMRYRMRKHGIG